jgi:cysteine desulfurase
MAAPTATRIVNTDYIAARPVDPRVVEAMVPWFRESLANPSSAHSAGHNARVAVEEARAKLAALVGAAKPREVVFTGTATESNNIAITGLARRNKAAGNHIVISAIEHISILNIAKALEKEGFQVTRVPVEKDTGLLNLGAFREALRKETVLASVQHANPEIGTVQPIAEVGNICREKDVYLHVDATDAAGHIPVDVQKEGVDLLTFSSNDMYGPMGVAALYTKDGTKVEPVLHGGGQEKGLRSGTENVPAIVGFGLAAEMAKQEMAAEGARLAKFRDRLIGEALKRIPRSHLSGHPTKRLPYHASLWFEAVEGEALTLNLNDRGILTATGSSCMSKTLAPSHVLHAIGLNEVQAHGSLIFSMGRWTTAEEVDYLLEHLPQVLEKLRRLSPLWGKEWEPLYAAGMKAEEELKKRVLDAEKARGPAATARGP